MHFCFHIGKHVLEIFELTFSISFVTCQISRLANRVGVSLFGSGSDLVFQTMS